MSKYDVALSFAGEDRSYVEQVADALRKRGINTFYDKYSQHDLWGKDLLKHLREVYLKQSKYVIVFVSKHYAKKRWTQYEMKSIVDHLFDQDDEYLLPVRLDDTELDEVRHTTGYIDTREYSPQQIAELFADKINSESEKQNDTEPQIQPENLTIKQHADKADAEGSIIYKKFESFGLSEEDIKLVIEVSEKIDVFDSICGLTYGAATIQNLISLTNDFVRDYNSSVNVRCNNYFSAFQECLNQYENITKKQHGFLIKKKSGDTNSVSVVATISKDLGTLADTSEKLQIIVLKFNAMFGKIIDVVSAYTKELLIYYMAGEVALEHKQSVGFRNNLDIINKVCENAKKALYEKDSIENGLNEFVYALQNTILMASKSNASLISIQNDDKKRMDIVAFYIRQMQGLFAVSYSKFQQLNDSVTKMIIQL